MAGNQEHIRHSKFRSFYSARTIFLDFSLFGRGQRAGDLLNGFVLRDATLSGYMGGGGVADWVGLAWLRGVCPAAPNGLGVWWWVSDQPWYLLPSTIHGQGSGKDWHEGPTVSTRDQ